jgi:hypothetical protein
VPDDGMPPPPLDDEFGLSEPFAEPSSRELEVAVADAECRASSGLSEALYDAEVEAQLAAVDVNEDALERMRANLEQDRRRVEAVIDEHS